MRKMELLAPAGSLEKLYYAYAYGADAAYIGIRNFSLRARADNFHEDEWQEVRRIKGDRKLFGALNIVFHNHDLKRLEKQVDYFSRYPFDAFIISDIGLVPLLKKYFPGTELHLSTQANCTNYESAALYRDMGFSRIIPGRETTLEEIGEIKTRLPELEIEVFIHGAMCMAYSGRCFLSSYLADRSANRGDCAHTCRWKYRISGLSDSLFLEEEERPGELYQVVEGENFSTILSSKDLCMIDYLQELRDAGVDSLKIEGRMKSIYYTAVITRAYRKALDALYAGEPASTWELYREELNSVSHREFSTGFFFGKDEISVPTRHSYLRSHLFLGSIGKKVPAGSNAQADSGIYELIVKNQITAHTDLEIISPENLFVQDNDFGLFDESMTPVNKADHGKHYFIKPSVPVHEGCILRRRLAAKG